MSFYDSDNTWSAPARQPSWEHQQSSQPPSRSTSTSTAPIHVDSTAFALQFEEIARATDNLMKSGKWYPGSTQASSASAASSARRESMPVVGRGHDFGAEQRATGPQRHQSVTEIEAGRPGSAGLQNFYAGQRFPGGRQSEAEQVLQAKRRMAAQRERELRNYHQEQQYNRTVTGVKTDRALSPTTMSEEDRRELIARQHRALYGDNSSMYNTDGSRAPSQDARSPAGRGPSPLAFDAFSLGHGNKDGAVQMPSRDRTENTTSPVSGAPPQQSFALLNDPQQNNRTSSSSPAGSPPLVQGQQKGGLSALSGVAPIGTRPVQGAGPHGKRSTTPLTPSSLSYGFNASGSQHGANGKDERSASSASNPGHSDKTVSGLGSWGSNSAVWGSTKNTLAVQPSVWG